MDRTERQYDILQKWVKNYGKGILVAATGFGKTYFGILTIQKVREKHPNGHVVIVVPRIPLKGQWDNALKNAGIDNYSIYVVNTAAKKKIECTHKIFDEIHRMVEGKEFSKALKNIKSKTAIGLTAKIESDPPFKIIDNVSKSECLKNGWVSEHEIYNLAVPLTDEEHERLRTINNTYKYYESLLGGKFNAFSNAQYYRKFISIHKETENFLINNYSKKVYRREKIPQDQIHKFRELSKKEIENCYSKARNAVIYYQAMNNRKKLLCQAQNKVDAIDEIISAFSDRKAVVFSEHKDFADQVGKVSDAYIYHSGRTDKQNREALEAFKNSDSGVIVSARSLNEGVDVPDCSLGITAAGNSKELDNIQREGRIIRKQGDKRALFINLYVPNTQDEKWLLKRQQDDAFFVNSIKEIIDNEKFIQGEGGVPLV